MIDEFERTHRPAAERGLRAVGNLAGHALDAAARRAQAGHDRPADARHRHQDRRRRDRHARAAARARPASCASAGPQVMKGYWNRPEETAHVLRTARRRPRVAAHRRHRDDRRGRLHAHRPAQEGHDHRRRLQRVSVGGRSRCSTRIPRCGWRRSSACPTRITAKSCGPASCSRPARPPPPDEIDRASAGRSLAPYKVPRQVEIRDTLPMSAVGKILYRVLRDELGYASSANANERRHATTAIARRHATDPERARVLPADGGRRRSSRRRWWRCSACGWSRSKKGASSSPARPTEQFYNGLGVAHGGFAATLLDSALGLRDQHDAAGRAHASRRWN